MKRKYLIIIAGWHFNLSDFYLSLLDISKKNQVDFFISSHKDFSEIDNKIMECIKNIPRCEIVSFENEGFDWGIYSQALSYLGERIFDYEYICFMHDDIEIKDSNFLNIFSKYISDNNFMVLGNCKNSVNQNFTRSHPHVIRWLKSDYHIVLKNKKWNTVRGSCFMVVPEIFKKIKVLPYKKGDNSGFGNWSVIAFGGIVTDLYGKNSIGTISNKQLKSDYIIEYERGFSSKSVQSEIREISKNVNSLLYRLKEVGYSIRRYYVDKFFFENIKYFNKNDRILDVGGKKINKRGYFDIEKYPLKTSYLNLDKSTKPDLLADAANIPTKNNFYDGIVLGEVMEHVSEPETVLRECIRVLKSKGKIIITVPFMYPIHADPYDYGRYTLTYWKRMFDRCGLKVLVVTNHGTYFAVLANMFKLGINEMFQKPQRLLRKKFLNSLMIIVIKILMYFDDKFSKSRNWLISGSTTGYGFVLEK